MSKLIKIIIAAALMILFASSASASLLLKLELDEIAASAPEVIRAIVVDSVTEEDPHDNTIYTAVTFETVKSYKGNKQEADVFTLTMQGGCLPDGKCTAVLLVPVFQMDEECILFTTAEQNKYCPLQGWGQGLYRIREDEEGNRYVEEGYGDVVVDINDGSVVTKNPKKIAKQQEMLNWYSELEEDGFTVLSKIDETLPDTPALSVEAFEAKLIEVIEKAESEAAVKEGGEDDEK
ncbi:hypothetical protein ACFL38_02325 [Candidatus Omnitrophota bacterium]